MENFEQKLIATIQDNICKSIAKQELIKVEYNDRISLPRDFIQSVYQSMDIEKIKAQLVRNLENEMADKIANKLITEYSNDIKQIMSNREIREDLRYYARDKIRAIADKVSE